MSSNRSANALERWTVCRSKVPKQEVIFFCQLITSFTVVVAALLNLSLTDRDKALWSTLIGAVLGYLVPNPSIRRKNNNSSSSSNESFYDNSTEQQFNGISSTQYGVVLHDQNKSID